MLDWQDIVRQVWRDRRVRDRIVDVIVEALVDIADVLTTPAEPENRARARAEGETIEEGGAAYGDSSNTAYGDSGNSGNATYSFPAQTPAVTIEEDECSDIRE